MLDALEALRESLAPHYDIERQIGAGGMARVFLAVEQHPHRRVAIKVLDPEVSTSRMNRSRVCCVSGSFVKWTSPRSSAILTSCPSFPPGKSTGCSKIGRASCRERV